MGLLLARQISPMENDDPVMEVYAQKAYEAYVEYWKASFGPEHDHVPWNELHQMVKACWIAVAKAIHGD